MIKIKEEFDQKLKKLGVKKKFVKNLKIQGVYREPYIDHINNEPDFEQFVLAAFIWGGTPEGYDFWDKIARS